MKKQKVVSIRVSEDTYKQLSIVSLLQGLSIAEIVRDAINMAIQGNFLDIYSDEVKRLLLKKFDEYERKEN